MLKDTIIRLCKERKITVNKLEKDLNFSTSAISRWDKVMPRIDNVQKVAEYFGVSVDYLLNSSKTEERVSVYEEKRSKTPRRAEDNDAKQIIDELKTLIESYGGVKLSPENRKIPIVTTITCGNNGIAYEDIDGYLMIDESLHGDLIALRTKGNSMINAGIDEGDLAIVRIQDDVESGEIAAILIDCEESTLKRVVKLPGGIALEGANPTYTTRYFMNADSNRIKIIGKLVEVRKRF